MNQQLTELTNRALPYQTLALVEENVQTLEVCPHFLCVFACSLLGLCTEPFDEHIRRCFWFSTLCLQIAKVIVELLLDLPPLCERS